MKLIVSGPTLEGLLVNLISKHEEVSFAIAWASSGTTAFSAFEEQRSKIRNAVIGTHFYQTHPDVLDSFVGENNIRFIFQPQGVFHPKIYTFRTGNEWDILVGSANFTKGAFTKNSEATLHFSNKDATSAILNETDKLIKKHWVDAEVVSKSQAVNYRGLWKTQQSALRRLSGSYGNTGKFRPPIHTAVMSMSWANYFAKVHADPHHGFVERCELLALIRNKFQKKGKFSELQLGVRKTIAGLPNKYNEHWAWFGSMKGAGVFHKAINNNDLNISNALDQIPFEGGVLEEHYRSYIGEFVKAFPNGKDGVALASRLLAMKRPDYFVCLDGKNRELLCSDFGIKKTGMNYERYWNEVIVPIMDSVWWNTEAPVDKMQFEVWKGRAALLDALFYQP